MLFCYINKQEEGHNLSWYCKSSKASLTWIRCNKGLAVSCLYQLSHRGTKILVFWTRVLCAGVKIHGKSSWHLYALSCCWLPLLWPSRSQWLITLEARALSPEAQRNLRYFKSNYTNAAMQSHNPWSPCVFSAVGTLNSTFCWSKSVFANPKKHRTTRGVTPSPSPAPSPPVFAGPLRAVAYAPSQGKNSSELVRQFKTTSPYCRCFWFGLHSKRLAVTCKH